MALLASVSYLLLGAAEGARDGRPFRLSVMLWTLRPKYTAEQGIELAASAGYDGFELVDEDQKWRAADVSRIRSRMEQLGIVCDAVSGVDTGFAQPNAAPRLVSELEGRMEQAGRLGCRRIILLSGKRDPAISRERQHALCVENLKRAGAAAAKRGFVLLLEPIDALENPPIYLTRVEEAFALARAVSMPSVAVLYDFYHQQRGLPPGSGVKSLLEPLKGNVELLQLVHVADVPGRHAPGTGTIDYAAIYRELKKENYSGWLAMEFLPTGDVIQELRKAAMQTVSAARSA